MIGFNPARITIRDLCVTFALLHAPVFAAEGGTPDPAHGFPKTAFEYARVVEPHFMVGALVRAFFLRPSPRL